MVILLGATGYVGKAFAQLLISKEIEFLGLSRRDFNYYDTAALRNLLTEKNVKFLINSAGYTGKPNVDACETHKSETLLGNSVLPGIIGDACRDACVPWGHVSSGCIYSGRRNDGEAFTENDPPNFCFRNGPCSFYSGSKALGEEVLQGREDHYVWRLRIPFNHVNGPRNYLSKLLNYRCLLEAENSLCHLDEFVAACWECWVQRIPYGIYNMTNTGSVTTKQVTPLIKKYLGTDKDFKFFATEDEFMAKAALTPRSNCVLDNSKIRAAGIPISDVEQALMRALTEWRFA